MCSKNLLSLILCSLAALMYLVYGPDVVIKAAPHVAEIVYEAMLRSVHVFVFAWWTLAWLGLWKNPRGRLHLFVIISLFAAAVTSEVAQIWIPRHTPTLAGGVSSVIGVAVGLLLSLRMRAVRPPEIVAAAA